MCTTRQKILVTSPIISNWFLRHFVPDVRHHQENVLSIAPEEAKVLLLLDNATANPDAEKFVSADGRIRTVFLPLNTTSIIQPMDLGVIASCKRFYQQQYLDDVLVVIEEEED